MLYCRTFEIDSFALWYDSSIGNVLCIFYELAAPVAWKIFIDFLKIDIFQSRWCVLQLNCLILLFAMAILLILNWSNVIHFCRKFFTYMNCHWIFLQYVWKSKAKERQQNDSLEIFRIIDSASYSHYIIQGFALNCNSIDCFAYWNVKYNCSLLCLYAKWMKNLNIMHCNRHKAFSVGCIVLPKGKHCGFWSRLLLNRTKNIHLINLEIKINHKSEPSEFICKLISLNQKPKLGKSQLY